MSQKRGSEYIIEAQRLLTSSCSLCSDTRKHISEPFCSPAAREPFHMRSKIMISRQLAASLNTRPQQSLLLIPAQSLTVLSGFCRQHSPASPRYGAASSPGWDHPTVCLDQNPMPPWRCPSRDPPAGLHSADQHSLTPKEEYLWK